MRSLVYCMGRVARNRFYPRTASPEELALGMIISWAANFEYGAEGQKELGCIIFRFRE